MTTNSTKQRRNTKTAAVLLSALSLTLIFGCTDAQEETATTQRGVEPASCLETFVTLDFEFAPAGTIMTSTAGVTITAVNDNANAVTGGRITRASITYYGNPVCGCVSRGVFENSHKKNALAFWPVWLPQET